MSRGQEDGQDGGYETGFLSSGICPQLPCWTRSGWFCPSVSSVEFWLCCLTQAGLRMLQEPEWFKPPPCCKWDVKHGKGTKEQ